LSSATGLLTNLKLELAYFGGRAWFKRRGAGVILRFERVRPERSGRFQPSRPSEITPEFLDRAIRALKRWKYDIIPIDEVCRRAVILASRRRFACLTFDGIYKDLAAFAYPVLSRHQVPFTVYVPTAFPDGIGEAWWLALGKVIAREPRVSLVMGRDEKHFNIPAVAEKYELYDYLAHWMRSLPPPNLSAAIKDLCTRYAVDLAQTSREISLSWADLSKIAADPLATIGCATVNFPVLSNIKDTDALREMTMGRAVLEAALQRDVRHFAYPFGDRRSWQRKHMVMAEEAGFESAVSSVPGVIEAAGHTPLRALPRISWDGRQRSLRAMRVILSGSEFSRDWIARSGASPGSEPS
jgi:peptidoglycan/xylan/chitin deacetylase (PgdA/CDA1 family)